VPRLDNGTNGVSRFCGVTTAIEHLLSDARRRRDLPPPAIRRLLREHAGLTQAEVATALGVGRPAVTRYETGARDPRGEVRLAYVELLERLARSPE
jgi:DNA-binding XRE family transcriptional regulator